jgi:hypothetical protein
VSAMRRSSSAGLTSVVAAASSRGAAFVIGIVPSNLTGAGVDSTIAR